MKVNFYQFFSETGFYSLSNGQKFPFQIHQCCFISPPLFFCYWEVGKICVELCVSYSHYVSKDQGYIWGFHKSLIIICILCFLHIVCWKLKSDLCDRISASKFHIKIQPNACITVNARLFYQRHNYYFITVPDVYAFDMSWLFVYFAIDVVGRSQSRTLPKARRIQERKATERCWHLCKAQNF